MLAEDSAGTFWTNSKCLAFIELCDKRKFLPTKLAIEPTSRILPMNSGVKPSLLVSKKKKAVSALGVACQANTKAAGNRMPGWFTALHSAQVCSLSWGPIAPAMARDSASEA